MNLRGRVGRLESRLGDSRDARECVSCGFPLPASVRPAEIRFVCEPPRVFGQPDTHDYSSDVCPTCGRRLVFHIPSPRPIGEDSAATLRL